MAEMVSLGHGIGRLWLNTMLQLGLQCELQSTFVRLRLHACRFGLVTDCIALNNGDHSVANLLSVSGLATSDNLEGLKLSPY